VPVHLTGEAPGVKTQGGIVDFVHRDVVLECLPADIPEHLTVDISNLMLHDGIRVRDLDAGGKWKAVSEPDMLLVHVVALKAEPEPVAADAAAPVVAAEPEVIKKGKAEKEDDEE
jgi:large subunit ribosomal protein L25